MQSKLLKLAVDSTAEEYWEKYFGTYGKQWVRKIPHRIAHALIAKSAELADAAHATKINVRPLAHAITKTGVRVEGTFRYATQGRTVARVFHAEFNHSGELKNIDSLPLAV
jgi:hypothetical protein